MNVSAISSTATPQGQLARDPASPQDPRSAAADADRKKVAAQFEAILVRQLLDKSVGSMLGAGEGAGGNVYGYLFTDVLAEKLTQGQGLGLGRVLEQQLKPRGLPATAPTSNPTHP